MSDGRLAVTVSSLHFRNPILLAAGTAGYGVELEDVLDLDAIGGIVTKAVSRAAARQSHASRSSTAA